MSSLLRYFVLFGLRAYSFGYLMYMYIVGLFFWLWIMEIPHLLMKIVIELYYSFVFRELVQFTGETLSVLCLVVAPTLPKGTGVTV